MFKPSFIRFACGSASLAALAFAIVPAHAQETLPTQSGDIASTGNADGTDEIVVTGSRLRSTGLAPTVPVTAITATDIAKAGTDNIADVLTDSGAVGIGTTDTNSQANATGAGLNLVNLRRLGAQRTLVLVNGRRQVAGTPLTAAVDLNTIPAPLIARTEISTGGASAVYGADAVSGVINIILRDDFEGLEARARGGITSRGDGESYGFTLTGGSNFAGGRGNLTASILYDKVMGVESTQRSYGANGLNVIANPANKRNNDGIPNFITRENIRFNPYNTRGVVIGLPARYTFNAAGTGVTAYDFGEIGNRNGRSIKGDGGFFEPYDNLSLPVERYSASIQGKYEVTDFAKLFFEGRFTRSKVTEFWQPTEDEINFAAPTFTLDNPFIPADLRTIMATAGQNSFQLYRINEEFGRRGSNITRDMMQFTTGFEGDVGRFSYTVFGGYGETNNSVEILNDRIQSRFLESLDVINSANGPICRSATARAAGCQALNLFGIGNASQAAINYSRFNDTYASSTSLAQAGADVTGSLFDLPAGPVAVALGTEWRETRASTSPSATIQQGLSFSPPERPVSGRISVYEAYTELRVPILRNSPLGYEMSVQGAGRASHYNTNGTQYSWNLGGSYSPAQGLTFRVVRSRAVRAPNIGELFSPANQGNAFLQDPCDALVVSQSPNRATGCAALGIPSGYVSPTNGRTTPVYTGGNINLEPETANTWTVGVVAQPPRIPGLSVTVDYYNINITNAIGSIPAQTLLNNCVDQGIAPADNPNCAAITRNATTRQITEVRATNLNIGRLFTRGVDVNVTYGFDLSNVAASLPGHLTLNANGTYIFKLRTLTDTNNPASEVKREGVLGDPQLEFLATATYAVSKVAVTWRTHFLQSQLFTWFSGIPNDQYDRMYTGDRFYHDVSISYDLTEKLNARINVNNVFDTPPPPLGANVHQGLNDASIYPNLGTQFFGTITARF